MNSPRIALIASVCLVVGCDNAPNSGSPSPGDAPGGYLNQMTHAQRKAELTTELAAMNRALESYYVAEGRFPADLVELMEKGYLRTIPELPKGYTWNYDTNLGLVSLENE